MSQMKFVVCDGNWISADVIPENSLDTYYVVTVTQTESKFNVLSKQYWRYFRNTWQYYNQGEWSSTWNPLFKVAAYQKITNLEAAPYDKFH